MKTQVTSLGLWILEVDDEVRSVTTREEILSQLSEMIGRQPRGRVRVSEDVGARSWFARFLGLSPRVIQGRFAIEWSRGISALIFFDEADSEYRAKDPKHPIEADEATRKEIAHGELTPHPIDECIPLDRALLAIQEFTGSGVRPDWMEFRYVR